MTNPPYELVNGPMDGARNFAARIRVSHDNHVTACVHWISRDYSLLYEGEGSCCGRPAKLYFVGRTPALLHPNPTGGHDV